MHAPITKNVEEAVSIIQEGRVVGIPTGTSYGLAADALQGNALQRVRNLKHRPEEKSFTVCVKGELLENFFDMSPKEQQLLSEYEGKAVTLLLSPKQELAHLAQDGRVGLRIVDHPLLRTLVNTLDVPITATSANISGEEPCYTPECVQQTFPYTIKNAVPMYGDISRAQDTTYDLSLGCILDAGPLEQREPSTIIRVESDDNIIVVREGAITIS